VSVQFRRSRSLVCYWQGRKLVVENYARRSRVEVTPLACEILNAFDRWRPASILPRLFPGASADSLADAVVRLVHSGLLDRSSAARDRRADALETWKDWSPAASFFHFSTKDGHAPIEPDVDTRQLRRRARSLGVPPPTKRYPHARHVALPPAMREGELPRLLLERRTWRRFSRRRPVDIDKVATLLGLTFGVQLWLDMPGIGRVALKTSPSGGARHPIEAYVLAPRVDGLDTGLYHYDGAAHRLELIRRGATRKELVEYVNGQWWFADAAFIVLMTAVFARTRWKYPASRAYRVVLIDAGHLCQTFCLVATWLGLAPFCTMALADSKIERALRIDGVTESILYTVGVGARPKTTVWPSWEQGPYGRVLPNLSK
jgi:SagB-type dehydrogenase family enzyme